ncbi:MULTISPECIES: hypothetical protein [Pectobacterium]|uniref:hypothetical protein n=1 Tax=Pectobacterium TaxID=122277 RepID=UPI00057E98E2|nr:MULTISPECIES: hypothetical protein [Pectobacterium]KHT18300.1 hypothetical protein RC97_11840 [Pectobacterium brasiliense]POD96400.1 hypothetical protein BVY06_08650 [Pectobacterium odoriferum]UUE38105.1 hypothetical protein L0Y26_09390 [Pectobacterium aroidearum]UUE42480.1 hypothetical protein L0Y25_09390 [Pectobacterium aroidearum]
MNFQELIKVLGIKNHKFEIEGIELYIRLPTVLEYELCDTQSKTIMNCVVDVDGNKIFSSEEEVNQLDFQYYTKIYQKINELLIEAMSDMEKK